MDLGAGVDLGWIWVDLGATLSGFGWILGKVGAISSGKVLSGKVGPLVDDDEDK